ncbi:MAG TPA: hypothetical protein VGB37_01005 [Candidatus Lokiarchaeia archaeon]
MILKISGYDVLIDDEDYDLIKNYNWYIIRDNWNNYVKGYKKNDNSKKLYIMHRIILNKAAIENFRDFAYLNK